MLLCPLPADYMQELQEQTNLLLEEFGSRWAEGGGDSGEELNALCVRLTGMPLSSVRQSAPEVLLAVTNPSGQTPLKTLLLADLMLLDAKIQKGKADAGAQIRGQVQAFCLMLDAIGTARERDQALYRPKLDRLYVALAELDAPYLRERLRAYVPGATLKSGAR